MRVYLLFAVVIAHVSSALAAHSVSLSAVPNPVLYGRAVTLTAVVSPAAATGPVVFYDGAVVLGLAAASSGQASLTTRQLAAGHRMLSARYLGYSGDAPGLSPPLQVTVNASAGSGFPNPVPFASGRGPVWVAVGDMNLDGQLDAVIVAYTDSSVTVLLGNGDGSFRAPLTYQAGANIYAVAIGDFNGDGKPDLAVTDAGNPLSFPPVHAAIDILLGNGDGTFQQPVAYLADPGVFAPVVGDFNGDGKLDIAVANQDSSDVSVFIGNGDGAFLTAVNYSTGTQAGAFGLAIGDFNGDGIADLAVAEDSLVILIGRGDGTFLRGETLAAGNGPADARTGDFNGDGKLDLVVTNFFGNSVSVFIGNGDGTFQPQLVYNVQYAPTNVMVGDFNGDGQSDLAVLNTRGSSPLGGDVSVTVLLGDGRGGLVDTGWGNSHVASAAYYTMALGDFNGDGVIDLLVPDYGDGYFDPGGMHVLAGQSCISISASGALNYDSPGGAAVLTISAANPQCGWSVTSSVPWIQITPASGTGSSQVTFTVASTGSGLSRTGTISVAGQTITVAQSPAAPFFSDVSPNSYYYEAVNELAQHHITSGCASGYCPNEVVTRDQMAIFIVRTVYGGDNFTFSQAPYFGDVPADVFGFQWIQKLYELGITTGCGGGNYCPDSPVSRDQMALFIIRARYGATMNFTTPAIPFFDDVASGYYAFPWIQRMKEDAITAGCGAISYCPDAPVTRGDMAIFLMRGGFNELLPAAMPLILRVTPATLAPGTFNRFTVTGVNTHFVQGTTSVVPVVGVMASDLVVTGATELSVTLTAAADAARQPEAIYVQTGAEEAVLPNGLVIQ